MILSELLRLPAIDPGGERVGTVIDARFVVDGRGKKSLGEARLHGFVVGRHAHHSFMGYERSGTNSPAGIARFLRWRERGAFLVLWEDVQSVTVDGLTLRAGYKRYSPLLPPTEKGERHAEN
jgi:hypothetical protein